MAFRVSEVPRASFLACSNLPLFASQTSSLLLRALSLLGVFERVHMRVQTHAKTHTQDQGGILKQREPQNEAHVMNLNLATGCLKTHASRASGSAAERGKKPATDRIVVTSHMNTPKDLIVRDQGGSRWKIGATLDVLRGGSPRTRR